MRILLLSTLLALGLGLLATGSSQAAGVGAGIGEAAKTTSITEDVQWRRCRMVRRCWFGPYGRRCRVDRVCRW